MATTLLSGAKKMVMFILVKRMSIPKFMSLLNFGGKARINRFSSQLLSSWITQNIKCCQAVVRDTFHDFENSKAIKNTFPTLQNH